MPSPPTAEIDICNGALLRLGQKAITSLTAASDNNRELLCATHYPTCRDTTLMYFPWPEARVRATLRAYTEPAGTLTPAATTGSNILFTASGTPFVAGDVGKTLRGFGVPGQATIIAFNTVATVHADITQDFAATTAIATGAWRLYNPTPDWGDYPFTYVKPTDFLTPYRFESKIRHQIEGELLLAETDTLNLIYIARLTDVTKYGPALVNAIELLLAATLAEPVTGLGSKAKQFYDLWAGFLRQARGAASLQGSPDLLGPYPLVDVRNSGVSTSSLGPTL